MTKWIIGLVISSPLLFGLALFAASEYGGETVELQTFDPRGSSYLTKLWVVDFRGEPWVRAGDPESAWLKRLEANPEVVLIRGGVRKIYRAEPWPAEADLVNEAMREKYGEADRIVSLIHEPTAVVPVRLVEPETP